MGILTKPLRQMHVLGIMSGTSLDGLDLALVRFWQEEEGLEYAFVQTAGLEYPSPLRHRLDLALELGKDDIHGLSRDYSDFLSDSVKAFVDRCVTPPDIIASHGHTLFHLPDEGYTLQIGDGQQIADRCGLPVICDFRTQDVALGGQGAPLVPIGDKVLFGRYSHCLNLGGIANISYGDQGVRYAYDICPCNLVLNHFSRRKGVAYDKGGAIAASGECSKDLLDAWNRLEYYRQPGPKSLGREWVEQCFLQVDTEYYSTEDTLNTSVEHIAIQIGTALNEKSGQLLVTGGGTFNTYLISRIQAHCSLEVVLPDRQLIEYKEALIFALLGYLRWHGMDNVLASVTGAKYNHMAGTLCYPTPNCSKTFG